MGMSFIHNVTHTRPVRGPEYPAVAFATITVCAHPAMDWGPARNRSLSRKGNSEGRAGLDVAIEDWG